MFTTIDTLVDEYKNFLDNEYPAHIKKHFLQPFSIQSSRGESGSCYVSLFSL